MYSILKQANKESHLQTDYEGLNLQLLSYICGKPEIAVVLAASLDLLPATGQPLKEM